MQSQTSQLRPATTIRKLSLNLLVIISIILQCLTLIYSNIPPPTPPFLLLHLVPPHPQKKRCSVDYVEVTNEWGSKEAVIDRKNIIDVDAIKVYILRPTSLNLMALALPSLSRSSHMTFQAEISMIPILASMSTDKISI